MLLRSRGMLFRDELKATEILKNVSYYRLKGYWWDMQDNFEQHAFKDNTYFETVIERYNFDRELRLILFDAIDRVEIALRTKMIYHLSIAFGPFWYKNEDIFDDKSNFENNLEGLEREFGYSQEAFIKDHKRKRPNDDPEAWKILEVASLGTLSKFYKNLTHNIPEKSIIANEMGLNFHNELSSWLEAITYLRNIIAHHSRIWSRNMVKRPTDILNNPKTYWFDRPLTNVQRKKPFLIISTLVYLCNYLSPENGIKEKILNHFASYPHVPIYKLGFLNNWNQQALWQ